MMSYGDFKDCFFTISSTVASFQIDHYGQNKHFCWPILVLLVHRTWPSCWPSPSTPGHPLNMLNNFCFHVYAQKSLSHTPTLSLPLSHSFTLPFTHSWHDELLLFSCLCLKVTLSLSHSHSFPLSFTLSRHAEQLLLFMSMLKSRCLLPKIAMLFLPHPHHHPVLVHRAGSQ